MVPSWSKRWLNMYSVITHYSLQPKYNIGEENDLWTLKDFDARTPAFTLTPVHLSVHSLPLLAVILITDFVFVCYCVLLMYTTLVQGENVQPKNSWIVLYSSQSSFQGERFSFCALSVAFTCSPSGCWCVFFLFHAHLLDWLIKIAPVGVSGCVRCVLWWTCPGCRQHKTRNTYCNEHLTRY